MAALISSVSHRVSATSISPFPALSCRKSSANSSAAATSTSQVPLDHGEELVLHGLGALAVALLVRLGPLPRRALLLLLLEQRRVHNLD